MSDEVLFYANSEFMSRKGIDFGSITLHPDGLPHGPQPGRTEESIGAEHTNELAVMVDTFRPLLVSRDARGARGSRVPPLLARAVTPSAVVPAVRARSPLGDRGLRGPLPAGGAGDGGCGGRVRAGAPLARGVDARALRAARRPARRLRARGGRPPARRRRRSSRGASPRSSAPTHGATRRASRRSTTRTPGARWSTRSRRRPRRPRRRATCSTPCRRASPRRSRSRSTRSSRRSSRCCASAGRARRRARAASCRRRSPIPPPSPASWPRARRPGVGWKATAGLHHPLRAEHALTYAADCAARRDARVPERLRGGRAPRRRRLGDGRRAGTARDRRGRVPLRPTRASRGGTCARPSTAVALARERAGASFGSCSFAEPVEGLRALGVIA